MPLTTFMSVDLPGAVLPTQRKMHFPRAHIEVHPFEHADAAEPLRNAPQFQKLCGVRDVLNRDHLQTCQNNSKRVPKIYPALSGPAPFVPKTAGRIQRGNGCP